MPIAGKREAERERPPRTDTSSGSGALQPATRGSIGLDLATAVDCTLVDTRPTRNATTINGPLVINGCQVGALLLGRSSSAIKGLSIVPGVIDADYTGTIQIMLYTLFPPIHIPAGSRIAQLLPYPHLTGHLQPLTQTERAAQGFGSTGTAAMLTMNMRHRPEVTVWTLVQTSP
ncbi:deoxyuridine 5'-triphosphate nucleotidohydrolase-like [Pogoniulus pusillus]|uniref:deoxyuridine 5'-triphosphate nucleotidohydrolase-like n=1 Tax=Pogoniulus pusillus TaxID=488313 RepID=UPI0030B95A9C